jgi:hypothetical protein
MRRSTILFFLAASFSFAQNQTAHPPQDHQATLNQQGDHVMGFSHEKTSHHFVLTQDGGLIEVRANDIKDTATLGQIQSHFQHIVRMFADGNFSAPMLVHGQDAPARQ